MLLKKNHYIYIINNLKKNKHMKQLTIILTSILIFLVIGCKKNPSCSDGVQNGTETGIDCGGNCSPCTTTSATTPTNGTDLVEVKYYWYVSLTPDFCTNSDLGVCGVDLGVSRPSDGGGDFDIIVRDTVWKDGVLQPTFIPTTGDGYYVRDTTFTIDPNDLSYQVDEMSYHICEYTGSSSSGGSMIDKHWLSEYTKYEVTGTNKRTYRDTVEITY
jgi:hypothetical protein